MILIFTILLITSIISSFFFLIPFFYSGIHYEKTTKEKRKTIIKFVLENKNKKSLICDLGSGDGTILRELGEKKVKNIGFEINPILSLISKYKIRKYKLENISKIENKDFWKINFNKFDIIIVFQFSNLMQKLENKIKNECNNKTLIISNHWKFKNIKLKKSENDIYMYELKNNH